LLVFSIIGFLFVKGLLPSAEVILDDRLSTDRGAAIVYPYDAVIHGERIFVAGGGHGIDVFDGNRWLKTMGRKGQGPGEFEHPPVRLEIDNGALLAIEMYYHRALSFSIDGVYLTTRSHRRQRNFELTSQETLLELRPTSYVVARDSGRMLRLLDRDCFLGTTAGPTEADHHISSFFLAMSSQGIVFVRRDGLVQVYSSECELLRQWSIPVHHLAKDVIEDDLANMVRKEYYAEKYPGTRFRKAFRFGIPIVGIAVDHRDILYTIASDERKMTDDRKPGACELITLNLNTGDHQTFGLGWAPSRLRISNGKLIMISSEDAMVKVWSLDAFQ